MAKERILFAETPSQDEITSEEHADLARRIATYSKTALQVGLKIDRIVAKHTAFDQALGALDRIFQIAPEVNMAHGAILVGGSGCGKKEVARYFEKTLPRSTLFSPGLGCVRVGLTAPSTGQLVGRLLRRYSYPFASGSESQLLNRRDILLDLVRAKGTRLIILENAQNLIYQGAHTRKQMCFNTAAISFICELMDEARVGIVLSGHTVLDRLLDLSNDLGSRVAVRLELKQFDANADWRGVVRAFAKSCNWFDLSFIDTDVQAKKLHDATKGCMRDLKRLITEVVLVAAHEGAECVGEQHMQKAFDAAYGFATLRTNPYARK